MKMKVRRRLKPASKDQARNVGSCHPGTTRANCLTVRRATPVWKRFPMRNSIPSGSHFPNREDRLYHDNLLFDGNKRPMKSVTPIPSLIRETLRPPDQHLSFFTIPTDHTAIHLRGRQCIKFTPVMKLLLQSLALR
jgi:hypothetical protein